jgi:hypothetical protein
VTVCINYAGITFAEGTLAQLFHFEGGAWVDRTVSLDTTSQVVCAAVTSLSPFAIFSAPARQVVSLTPARLWVGLKNSDDQGTQFDLRVELSRNGSLVSSGTTLCVTGVTRNPNKAKEVSVPFAAVTDGVLTQGDELALKVLTRIGTNPDGSRCAGHANATGLRLYYDAIPRPSRFGAEITPDELKDHFLRSDGSSYLLATDAPTSPTAKTRDSGPVKYAGGNAWSAIGSWSMTVE